MTQLKNARNKIRSHTTFSLSVYKMSANLLDLHVWKIGSKRKPDSSKEEHLKSEKVRKYEESQIRKNSNQHGKKNFPGLNLTRRRMKCSALCAASIRQ